MANQVARRGNGGAVQQQGNGGGQVDVLRSLKAALDSRVETFGEALAGRIDPSSFVRVAYTTISRSHQLAQATPASIMMALLEAAELGLMPNGVTGEAYLVPFNNKVKLPGGGEKWETHAVFMPGYRGLMKLARQSGLVTRFAARAVREGDEFDVAYGLEERLHHVPSFDDTAQVTRVYAIAYLRDDAPQFEVLTRAQVEAVRRKSKAANNGPWVTDWEAMALKTAIRRLFKMLPSSDRDLTRALEADDREFVEIGRVEAPEAAPTRTEGIRGRLQAGSTGGAPAPIYDDPPPPPFDDSEEVEDGGEAEDVGGAPAADSGPRSAADEALSEFFALVGDMKPSGGDASEPQRERIRRAADALYGAGTDDARTVRLLADRTDLGKKQAGLLIAKATATAMACGIDLSEADGNDEGAAGEGRLL